jgi:hypothetical protein
MNDELMSRLITEVSGIREELAGIREAQVKSGWIASLPHYIGVVAAVVLVIVVAINILVTLFGS